MSKLALFGVLICVFLLAGCGSSEAEIATAVAATVAAQPTDVQIPEPTETPTELPVPTSTPKPTAAPIPTEAPYQPQFSDYEPLICELDEFKGISFCTPYKTARREGESYDLLMPVNVAPYVGIPEDDRSVYVRWSILYHGDDWIFIDQIIFLVDGERYELPVDDLRDITTDVWDSGDVMESYDREVDDLSLLVKIARADRAEVRLSGERYKDWLLTDQETYYIARVLATYEEYGGRLP